MKDPIRRVGWLTAVALVLALSGEASTLSYIGETTTGSYIPGYFQLEDELSNAHSNNVLGISKLIFAPDAFHVASLSGDATFGRMTAATYVGTSGPDAIQGFSSDLVVGFTDTVTIHGASSGFLSLDVSVHGALAQSGADGDFALGHFGVLTESTDESEIFTFSDLCMAWFGATAPSYCNSQLDELAPLNSAMTITPDGLGGVVYHGQATILIPFSLSTFNLHAGLSSSVLCHAPCSATSDLGHTALLGGLKILDSSMAPISGAFLTSESGYDYVIAPAAASAVPEPGTAMLVASALGLAVWRRRGKP